MIYLSTHPSIHLYAKAPDMEIHPCPMNGLTDCYFVWKIRIAMDGSIKRAIIIIITRKTRQKRTNGARFGNHPLRRPDRSSTSRSCSALSFFIFLQRREVWVDRGSRLKFFFKKKNKNKNISKKWWNVWRVRAAIEERFGCSRHSIKA